MRQGKRRIRNLNWDLNKTKTKQNEPVLRRVRAVISNELLEHFIHTDTVVRERGRTQVNSLKIFTEVAQFQHADIS